MQQVLKICKMRNLTLEGKIVTFKTIAVSKIVFQASLPCLITYNAYMRSFQYKILNNVLFLNKKLHTFGIKPSPLCSFCNLYDETPYHIFFECDCIKCLWSDLVQCFENNLI